MKAIILLNNAQFSDSAVMEKVYSLPAKEKLCRDIVHTLSNKSVKSCDVVYATEQYMPQVKELFKDSCSEFKVFELPEDEKSLNEMNRDDFDDLKKRELEEICKENEVFSEIKYSMLKKQDLIDEMMEALKK